MAAHHLPASRSSFSLLQRERDSFGICFSLRFAHLLGAGFSGGPRPCSQPLALAALLALSAPSSQRSAAAGPELTRLAFGSASTFAPLTRGWSPFGSEIADLKTHLVPLPWLAVRSCAILAA